MSCGDDGGSANRVEARAASAEDFNHRSQPITAWTGTHLFVYGGVDSPGAAPLGDAALVDPSSGEVTALPPAPFEVPLDSFGAAAVVGDAVFLLGILCSEPSEDNVGSCEPGDYAAAQFSLAEQTWRSVELPSELGEVRSGHRRSLGVTSDGRVVLFLGPANVSDPAIPYFWTYSPASGEWANLPVPTASELMINVSLWTSWSR